MGFRAGPEGFLHKGSMDDLFKVKPGGPNGPPVRPQGRCYPCALSSLMLC